jgi:hypothetical protein
MASLSDDPRFVVGKYIFSFDMGFVASSHSDFFVRNEPASHGACAEQMPDMAADRR